MNEYINALKKESATGPMVENNQEFGYRIWILHRGEQLFYQDGNRALICEIQVRSPACVFVDSIQRWDDGSEISIDEKQLLVKRIVSYFTDYQKMDLRII